jgi:hypothetical protein
LKNHNKGFSLRRGQFPCQSLSPWFSMHEIPVHQNDRVEDLACGTVSVLSDNHVMQ